MKNKINCIMLIDDDDDDNFYHERVIKKNEAANIVIVKQTAMSAIEYLTSEKDHNNLHPDLIFLDINMPGMNGWEFIQEYNKMDKKFQCHAVVIMLTTSINPTDKKKAQLINGIADFKTKPLTKQILEEVLETYYSNIID